MKHIILVLILSACTTEPTIIVPETASTDAVLTDDVPGIQLPACTSTVHDSCGERPERKPTEEWAHDIDLWAKCAEEARPSLVY